MHTTQYREKCILTIPNYKQTIINGMFNVLKMSSALSIAHYRASSTVIRERWNYIEEEHACYRIIASDHMDINNLFNLSEASPVDKSL